MYCSVGQMWNMWGMGTGMWVWILIIAGIAYYFYGGYRSRRTVRQSSPLEIAKLRYARGEITEEEFEAIKKNLIE